MNKWFRRAVGTVGVAGGMLLLGTGTAHADDAAQAPGMLDDLLSPAGGPNNLLPDGPVALHTGDGEVGAAMQTPSEHGLARDVSTNGGMPNVLGALALSNVVPGGALGLPGTGTVAAPRGEGLPLLDGFGGDRLLGGLPLANLLPLGGGLPGGALQNRSLPAAAPSVASDAVHLKQSDTSDGAGDLGATEGLPVAGGALPLGGGGSPLSGGGSPLSGGGLPLNGAALPLGGGVPLYSARLPVLDRGLPSVGGQPLRGQLNPVNDMGIPLGGQSFAGAEALTDRMPRVEGLPLLGNILQNNTIGTPLSGGYTPRHAAA